MSKEISRLKDDIIGCIEEASNAQKQSPAEWMSDGLSRNLGELKHSIYALQVHASTIQNRVNETIFSSLEFPTIAERERNVKDAHPETCGWLLEPQDDSCAAENRPGILKWLLEGNGVFWVSGKAGSGKSTLMKFLHRHPRTIAALKEWASPCKSIVASFFFWSAGTSMQRSQRGLLQSLLVTILRQCPDLIPFCCSSRWTSSTALGYSEPWTQSELLNALTNLRTQTLRTFKFCFFIDGLDEYEGEHLGLLNLIGSITSSDSVKICISSRPWNVFEKFCGDNYGQKIKLQDVNKPDIWCFANERLHSGAKSNGGPPGTSNLRSLADQIVQRSSGVFLWVFLIVRSLVQGMTNEDTEKELQARFDELPTELEDYFRCILKKGDKIYQRQAARLYLIQLHEESGGLFDFDIAHFDEEDMPVDDWDDLLRRQTVNLAIVPSATTQVRVLARCQDLLEFDRTGRLQFLHRTVKDFLETREVLHTIKENAGANFDADLFLCQSVVLKFKIASHSRGEPLALHPSPHLIFRHTERYIEMFRASASRLAKNDRFPKDLVKMLNTEITRNLRGSQFPHGNDKSKLDRKYDCHREGWFIECAEHTGITELLRHFLEKGTFKGKSANGSSISMPSLEVALTYVSLGNKAAVVAKLLEAGAHPNEKSSVGTTVWKSYVASLAVKRCSSKFVEELRDKVTLMLLQSGAEPKVLTDAGLSFPTEPTEPPATETLVQRRQRNQSIDGVLGHRSLPVRLKRTHEEWEIDEAPKRHKSAAQPETPQLFPSPPIPELDLTSKRVHYDQIRDVWLAA